MRIATLFATVTLIVICTVMAIGCARVTAESTVAIYDPKTDLKFDPRLLGVWLPDTVCVNLRRGDANTYLVGPGAYTWLVIFGDALNKTPTPDAIHLERIGNYDYFFAAPKPGEAGTTFTGCCKVEFADERITLRGLNLQAVTDDLLKHPEALKHDWKATPSCFGSVSRATTQPTETPADESSTTAETFPTTQGSLRNGNLKITDDPAAIRAYLIKHQDDADFFSDPVVLYRVAK